MEFFKSQTSFPFMRFKKVTTGLAACLCLVSLGLLFTKGLNYGLEFTGGTQIEMRFVEPITVEQVQSTMQDAGFTNARVQHYGSTKDVLVRIANAQEKYGETELQQKIVSAFEADNLPLEVRRIEYVGSEVGQQLAEQGALAVIVAIFATMLYIAVRFEWRFAVSAALALGHDALMVIGAFVLFKVDFDLAALAAILAVVGYSLNDKIVVFDRVRENFRILRQGGTPEEIMNGALNQTLSRTIMTSVMTLLVVLALLFFGGESLFSFSLALTIGIIVGTYSSIFVASALAIILGLSRQDLLPKPKLVLDDRP